MGDAPDRHERGPDVCTRAEHGLLLCLLKCLLKQNSRLIAKGKSAHRQGVCKANGNPPATREKRRLLRRLVRFNRRTAFKMILTVHNPYHPYGLCAETVFCS
jgi:hypothetical protein